MTQFQGFETKQQAQDFIKEHGGRLTFEERTPKRKSLTSRGREYMMAVKLGGLDPETYPFCVQWNI